MTDYNFDDVESRAATPEEIEAILSAPEKLFHLDPVDSDLIASAFGDRASLAWIYSDPAHEQTGRRATDAAFPDPVYLSLCAARGAGLPVAEYDAGFAACVFAFRNPGGGGPKPPTPSMSFRFYRDARAGGEWFLYVLDEPVTDRWAWRTFLHGFRMSERWGWFADTDSFFGLACPLPGAGVHGLDYDRDRKFTLEGLAQDFGIEIGAEAVERTKRDMMDKKINVADPEKPPPRMGVTLKRADRVAPKAVDWLWKGYLARGKLHVLAGASTAGKTTYAVALAAVLSNGGKWPDGTVAEPADVVIWSGEDDRHDTLVPRLMAAGADLSRVHFVGDVRVDAKKKRGFDPAKDMPELSAAMKAIGNVGLLIVDSLASAVAGDGHKNGEVRRGLQPVVDLAERHGAAVLGILHFSKGSQGRPAHERVNGSVAFGALARVVLYCIADEDEAGNFKRKFVRGISNIGKSGGGFQYEIVEKEIPLGDGTVISNTCAIFGEALAGSADALVGEAEKAPSRGRPSTARDDAEVFLRDALAAGPRPVTEVTDEAINGAGFSAKTLKRATYSLGIVRRKDGVGGGWTWSLPTAATAFPDNLGDVY